LTVDVPVFGTFGLNRRAALLALVAQRFFGIWLSPKTSEPKLRDALLGGAKTGS